MIYITEHKMEALMEAVKKHTKLTEAVVQILTSVTQRCQLTEEEIELYHQAMVDHKSMRYYVKKYETL